MTPGAVPAENRISNEMRQLSRIVTDPLGFPTQLRISLHLLSVLRCWFGSNVHVTGFATTNIVRL